MKNLDVKKLLLFIIIIAVLILLIVGGINLFGKGREANTEETQNVEALIEDTIVRLTYGYTTAYDGLDVLFDGEKHTTTDLEDYVILHNAISYAASNDIQVAISTSVMEELDEDYSSLSNATYYAGEGVRTAIKQLFDTDWTDKSASNVLEYNFSFIYDMDRDVYVEYENNLPNEVEATIDYSITETTVKGDKLYVEMAVAYVYLNEDSTYTYASDSKIQNVVVENLTELNFPTDKIDSFDKYKITFKIVDNTYAFESIEKIS